MGVAIFIEPIERVRELEGETAFCCVAPTLAKMFRIMGLLRVTSIRDTEMEAAQALGGPE
jgi:anti-anti-sigma regulatory factor